MKPRFPLLVAPIVLGILAGCTTSGTLVPAATNASAVTYEHGRAVLRSAKANAVAVVLLTPQFESQTAGLPAFLVVAANGGKQSVPFSPANVRAYSGGNEVKVYTVRELAWKIQLVGQREAEAISENAAADFMEAHASQVAQSHTFDLPAIGSGRYIPPNPTPVIDPALSTVMLNQMVQTAQGMTDAFTSRKLDDLDSLLHENLIEPGQRAGGVIKLHAENIKVGTPLKLVVSIGEEQHEFVFDTASR